MTRIHELENLHDWYNDHEFGFELNKLTLLITRNRHKDGYYEYRAHKDWTPIRHELWRASITICDGCWAEGTVEDTLVHEMIHQWQAEILNEAPHHNETFVKKAKELDQKYDLEVFY